MGKRISATVATAVAAVALANCSGNGQSPPGVTVVQPTLGKLQLAVGTANIFGDAGAAAVTGLNVVTTFRQQPGAQTVGDTAALVNTPTLSGPFALPGAAGTADDFGATIATGPGPAEVGKSTIASTPQQAPGASTIPASTLGVSGGATGQGLEPFNYTTTGNSSNAFGAPASLVPFAVPAYDAVSMDPNAFVPWGGPPAFDPNKNGKGTRDNSGFPNGVLGVSEGLDVFAGVAPAAGTYTLSVAIPTSSNSSSSAGTVTTTARLASTAVLPPITPATVTLDGLGGGTFAATLPAGVTDAYVQIEDVGPASGNPSCNGSDASPVYYTLHVTASGAGTLPATDGPGNPGSTTPSICTAAQNAAANAGTTDADVIEVQTIGFDYPAYAANYPNSNGNPAPTIAGANGQADVTISSKGTYPAAAATAIRLRMSLHRGR